MSNSHYKFDTNLQSDDRECSECSSYEREVRNLQHRLNDNRKDTIEIQKMYDEVCKERDGWIAEYCAARAEIERLKERIDMANQGKKFTDEI